MGEVAGVVRLIPQEPFQQRTFEKTVVFPASQIQELTAGVNDGISQERVSERFTKRIGGVLVPLLSPESVEARFFGAPE